MRQLKEMNFEELRALLETIKKVTWKSKEPLPPSDETISRCRYCASPLEQTRVSSYVRYT